MYIVYIPKYTHFDIPPLINCTVYDSYYALYAYMYLLDISRQLACMKLGSREKYQPIQYCWVHTSRLLGYLVSYMPFAYRYPTNLLQRTDRTAFTLAGLMLSCLCAVTNIYFGGVT